MKANELRVTNLIENDRIVNAIIFIGYDSVQLITPQGNNITAKLDLIKPIPLTEEWLLKFGFVDTKSFYHFEKKYNLHFNFTVYYDGNHCQLMGYDNDEVVITSVHQLQNLYFALTGEELEVKP